MPVLFEKLGGAAVIDLAVDRFYDKVLADPRIKHLFVDTDMRKQRAHQKAFLTFACGGSSRYDGRGMREAHARLVREHGLDDSHFDAVVENLTDTLRELGTAETLIQEVAALTELIRADVLGR